MKGSTFKRCGCRDGNGKPMGDACPNLSRSGHGSWFYRADIGPNPTTGQATRATKGRLPDCQGRSRSPGHSRRRGLHWRAPRRRADDGRRLLRDLRAEGRGAVTIRRIHAVLRSALSDAHRTRLVRENVAANITGLPERSKARPTPWEPDMLGRFLDETAWHRFGALYEFLAFTGLRRGEACALRWADVDLERRVLTVRSSLTQVGGSWVEGKPKTDSGQRRVDLGARTVALLLIVKVR